MLEISVSPPDPEKIPNKREILGVTVLMITALYRRQEFFRCSFFVYNNYEDGVLDDGSGQISIGQVVRSILVDKPRIRLYEIMWDYSSAVRMVPENMKRMGKVISKGKIVKKQKEGKKSKNSK